MSAARGGGSSNIGWLTYSNAPAMSGVAMLVPLIEVSAQLVVAVGLTSQWLADPAALAA